ncbi:YbdK family carboxylate-amine ligase [Paeniglutamicibacter sp. NPDC012692]|uniref:carboxylate-amine ligase n=1 Tax=Paeniglutamicibacter sp. NPDC012692 TaxID=3364388 RepID=UPI0036C30475
MRTFGVEEEFFIVDPYTGLPVAPPAAARAHLLALSVDGTRTVGEFLACQVESNGPVCTHGGEALASARTYRATLARATLDMGLQAVPLGTPPRFPEPPAVVSPGDRYRAITSLCEGIATEHYLCGLHVHVGIEDTCSGVIALNEIRRWLPVLTACGSNSPYWRGSDTGFASWRNIHYRRWAVQGIPPHFTDELDYERRVRFMLDSDVVLDAGHISWGARLSAHHPTLEVRVADAQLNAANSVLLALIVRSLVDTSLNGVPRTAPLLAEALDLAQWQAAKFGLHGNHLDPLDGTKTSATRMLRSLLDYIQHALKQNGDFEYVSAGLERLMEHGTGADIQRARFHRGGFNAVLDEAAAAIAA